MPQSEEFDEALIRATVRLDGLRAEGLKGMETVTVARQAALEREEGRLSQALGAEHPRVKALTVRRADGAARLRDLKLETARAETVAPKAAAAEWVLHGYVFSAELSPAVALAVALVDAQGKWLRTLGHAATNERGYFQLRTSVPSALTPGAAAATAAPPIEGFMRITDRNRAQVYRGATAIPVSPGRVEYQEIVLEGEGAHGGVPPEDDAPEKPGPSPGPAPKPRKRA